MQKPSECRRLEALLETTLVDNEDWRVLTELAMSAGHGALAQRFAQALADERRYLASVRAWAAPQRQSKARRSNAITSDLRG